MAIKTKTATINKLYFGSIPIKKVYSGSTLIWQAAQAATYYYTAGIENVAWGFGGAGGTVTEGASYVTLATSSSALAKEIYWYTTNLQDLTGKTTLYVDWASTTRRFDTGTCRFLVSDAVSGYTVYDAEVSLTPPFTRVTTSLSVSGFSGDYYIRIHAYKAAIPGRAGTITLTVHNVWAE